MKLIDALAQFETRISKAEGGVVTMTPEDLVKYVGDQLALADGEGDEGKERREALKAVIAAAKASEASGATSFEVKVFAPAAKAAPESDKKDPILDALAAITEQVKDLSAKIGKAAETPKVEPEKPAAEGDQPAVNKAADEATSDENKDKDELEKAAQAKRVHWPLDLNDKR